MATEDVLPSYLDSPEPLQEISNALQSVPWVAVALAVHVILLVVAWFILPVGPPARPMAIHGVSVQLMAPPPLPPQKPERNNPFEDVTMENPIPSEDDRIVPDPTDTNNQDDSQKPNRDLAHDPSEEPSEIESPHPDRSRNSSIGLSGRAGGGDGPGGKEGGRFPERGAGPGGRPVPLNTALHWLADHQNAEGYWSATTFGQDSTRKDAARTHNIEFVSPGDPNGDKGWEITVDVGLTGLALLAFTTAGCDHKDPDFGDVVRCGIRWLRKVQGVDGCFGEKTDDHYVYNHAICTMALAEIYGLSLDPIVKPIVERAVDFILSAQNPAMGWRYDVKPGDNDSSVTGWMVLALHTCKFVGIEFDGAAVYSGAANWYEMATVDVNGYPRCGYDSPGSDCSRLRSASENYDSVPSMDAIYIMSMVFMNKAHVSDGRIRALARGCVEKDNLPQWKHNKLDFYYWYYASLALFQVGGGQWEQWNTQVMKVLIDNQRGYHAEDVKLGRTSPQQLDEHGSWDAVDAWSACGGRVYTTAMGVLILESIKRHEKHSGK